MTTMAPPTLAMLFEIIYFLIVSSLVIGGWKIVDWVWMKPKKIEKRLREQGLAGNPYRLLYGDTKDMAAMINKAKSKPINLSDDVVPRVLPLHHHIIQKYGKASFIWIGPVARVLIMEPQLVKQILNNNHIFKKPTPNPLSNFLVCGLSAYEDEKWAKHRRIISPAFYLQKLKHMVPAMHTGCGAMLNKWEKLGMEEEKRRSIEIDVQPYLEELTSDVISRTAFGSSHEEGRRIFELQKEQSELTRQVLQSVYVPGSRYIPTRRNRRMKEINNQLCLQLKGIIKKRKRSMKMGDCGDDDNDLLGMLLKCNEKEIEEKGSDKAGMKMEEVIEECKAFYLAGQESTSNLLSWTMLMLSIHQNWQQQARDEVLRVFGDAKHVDFDASNQLKVVTMILYEVLRLYPPAIIFNRIVHEETKLGEMRLPAGVHVLLPTILIHRDQQLWGEDAKEFKPERFAQGIAKATKNKLSYFPFSWGPRICIGNNFALMEAKIALAMILRRFSFELSPSYAHSPSFVVSLQPQHGIHLTLTTLHEQPPSLAV